VGDFTFLPLHAAGIYTSNNICAADYFVSSYTPSLSSLINARKNFSSVPREQLKALLVAEPSAPGYRPLPQVTDEANAVEDLWRLSSITSNVNIAPSVQTVLDALPEAHILHLACHGIQQADPLESHFALRDGPLSIAALTKLELPNAVLAFLSACETAKGDENQPDQAIHLAASLLFCGFRSVIGTMW
jgi:CHAT domain-containing protein